MELNIVISSLIGLVAGVFFTVCWSNPRIGSAVARALSVLLLGVGTGLIVWISLVEARGEMMRPPMGLNLIAMPSEAYGWGVGFTLAGALAAIYSFRRSAPAASSANDRLRS